MQPDSLVMTLLEEFLELGRPLAEVCQDYPELLPLLLESLEHLRHCDAQLDSLFPIAGPAAMASTPAVPQSTTDLPAIPGYQVFEVLGYGGMGIVYRARHLRLNRMVALKMLLAGVDATPEYRNRFLREAEAIAALRHPNIVQIHDLGDQNGQPYFTMELVAGGNLGLMSAGIPLAPHQACSLLVILAAAVQAAHEAGIVHRDLKPANILLTTDGEPKISDFGLARRREDDSRLTWVGTAVGTPGYMAPEQADGGSAAVCPAVDIYALGAILYELLTGRLPFLGATVADTVRQLISEDPVPPSKLNSVISRDLEVICLKCLQKEPHLRYSSASALASDLKRFMAGEAIAARPDGQWMRLLRRVRRQPRLTIAVSMLAVLATVLLGDALWRNVQRREVARETAAKQTALEIATANDFRHMAQGLKESSWPAARAALERAKERLVGPGHRHDLDQGIRELELAKQLDEIRMSPARGIPGFDFSWCDQQYRDAFRGAEIGELEDDPTEVAHRMAASNIRRVLVDALDDWAGCTQNPVTLSWVMTVARETNPDPTGWRDRARNPKTASNEAYVVDLIATAPESESCVALFLSLDRRLKRNHQERHSFLNRIYQANSGDFWLNQTIGDLLTQENRPREAIRFYKTAVAIRPQIALSHHALGYAAMGSGQNELALSQLRQAAEIEPTYILTRQVLASLLSHLGKYDEAIQQLQGAIVLNSNAASLRSELGHLLELRNLPEGALDQHRVAIEIDPSNPSVQRELRNALVRMGHSDEARAAWHAALQAKSPDYLEWTGYAEFCLFIGQEANYVIARQSLLSMFGASTDPAIADRTARACLLLAATEDELRQLITLIERALDVGRSGNPFQQSSLLFARGLAEYRQGKFDQAIATLEDNAWGGLGPAPNLALAMALHKHGRIAEARNKLALSVLSKDWRAIQVRDQNDWFLHVLRREAERLIIPDLSDFLAGTYQPQDNDERMALLGVCQFTNRLHAAARLYADSFAAAPQIAAHVGPLHRYGAARAAAQIGTEYCGTGSDLSGEERMRWRKQAYDWLKLELEGWSTILKSDIAANHGIVWTSLTFWVADPALVGLREPKGLDLLPAEEREHWLSLWKEVDALLTLSRNP
ncbi:MAG: tetratricopeptide repeat protein [Schlesneria sp.]|nr:tetratricopeptide repeat protein [Schlesneria sp.]